MEFEWNAEKAAANVKKHGVDFNEAAAVFADPLSVTFGDPDHSEDEDRYISIGTTDRGHLVIVSHTDREDRIRIISARKATRGERRAYAEES
jgi:uncharacterized protein